MAALTPAPAPSPVPARGGDAPAGADPVRAAVAAAFEAEWGRVVATLIRTTGDWALAEECAQDAFAAALERWPRDGVPDRPGAWLTTTARHRALDRLRRSTNEAGKLREVAVLASRDGAGAAGPGGGSWRDEGRGAPDDDEDEAVIEDDRLRLIFTCCHPALALESRVALTLRTLGGLTVAEIARSFLVSEAAMQRRLVRARQKIKNAGVPYRVPPDHLLGERLSGVLAVLYLVFTEGYAPASGGMVVREPLADESIRLTRVLADLMPDEPEVLALLALELLQHSRRAARQDAAGDLVTLEEQDRSLWDAAAVAEGVALLRDADRRAARAGAYHLQARIAACHATSASAGATDWAAIAAHYDDLLALTGSPVIELNRAVAVAMARGPEAGLALTDALAASGRLAGHHLVPSVRADLLRRLGRSDEAADAYREALAHGAPGGPPAGPNDAERRYLERRLAEVARS